MFYKEENERRITSCFQSKEIWVQVARAIYHPSWSQNFSFFAFLISSLLLCSFSFFFQLLFLFPVSVFLFFCYSFSFFLFSLLLFFFSVFASTFWNKIRRDGALSLVLKQIREHVEFVEAVTNCLSLELVWWRLGGHSLVLVFYPLLTSSSDTRVLGFKFGVSNLDVPAFDEIWKVYAGLSGLGSYDCPFSYVFVEEDGSDCWRVTEPR